MTTAEVSTPSASNSSRMALPAPSSESFVRMEGERPQARGRGARVAAVAPALRFERVRAELRVRLGERRDRREVVHAGGAHAHDHGRGGVAAGDAASATRAREARDRRAGRGSAGSAVRVRRGVAGARRHGCRGRERGGMETREGM